MSSVAASSSVAEDRRRRSLWAGGLAGPAAWFVQLVGVFALTTWSCAGRGRLVLHLLSLLCLLTTAAGGWISWSRWGEVDRAWPGSTDEASLGRARFMGATGVLAGVLFAWIICVQWIAIAVLDPCPP